MEASPYDEDAQWDVRVKRTQSWLRRGVAMTRRVFGGYQAGGTEGAGRRDRGIVDCREKHARVEICDPRSDARLWTGAMSRKVAELASGSDVIKAWPTILKPPTVV